MQLPQNLCWVSLDCYTLLCQVYQNHTFASQPFSPHVVVRFLRFCVYEGKFVNMTSLGF